MDDRQPASDWNEASGGDLCLLVSAKILQESVARAGRNNQRQSRNEGFSSVDCDVKPFQ